MLLLRVFEYALGAEHLVAALAEELDLPVLVRVAEGDNRPLRALGLLLLLTGVHGQPREHRVVDRQGVRRVRVHRLVEGALYLVVLADLCRALVA